MVNTSQIQREAGEVECFTRDFTPSEEQTKTLSQAVGSEEPRTTQDRAGPAVSFCLVRAVQLGVSLRTSLVGHVPFCRMRSLFQLLGCVPLPLFQDLDP